MMNELRFDSRFASLYGVDEAIMINLIWNFVRYNALNQKHYIGGKYWSYNSTKAFCGYLPFWSEDKIKRTLKSLERNGVILKENFNKTKFDRTTWYSFTDEFSNRLTALGYTYQNQPIDSANLHNGKCENAQSESAELHNLYQYNNNYINNFSIKENSREIEIFENSNSNAEELVEFWNAKVNQLQDVNKRKPTKVTKSIINAVLLCLQNYTLAEIKHAIEQYCLDTDNNNANDFAFFLKSKHGVEKYWNSNIDDPYSKTKGYWDNGKFVKWQ